MTHYPYIEFSGGLQQYTTPHLRKANELDKTYNARFDKVLGAFVRRPGSQKYDATNYPTIPQSPIDKPTLGAYVARYPTGPELWMASNVAGDATANVRRWDPVGLGWVNVNTGLLPTSEVNFNYDLSEVWVSSYQKSTDTIGTPFTVDQTHNVSLTRQLNFAPFARFYIPYGGSMWAANCQVGTTRYRDRLYKSSGPTGAVAYSRSAQTDVNAAITLVDNTPTMTSLTTPIGVAAASSTFSSGQAAWEAFDDNIGPTVDSKWLTASGSTTGWLSYDFGVSNSKTITSYSVVGVLLQDAATATRAPKTWTFQGSPDNSTWTTIDTQTNVPAFAAGEQRIYSTGNTTAYRYYRINVSANQG